MKQRIRALQAQIKAIKRELAELEVLRPGSLSRQFNVCGSPGCRCKASPPQKHGPYFHLSYTRNGKGGTRSIQKADVPATWADIGKARRLLGWEPQTRLEAGLKALVDWYARERAWASQVETTA